jgi:electron transfer flavoprotein beta subunit
MDILVCISQVPDTTTKISFIENNSKFNDEKVTFIVNPYDEWYALVKALELKETLGGNVTIITVGNASVEPIIRKALAIGADTAVRIDINPIDSFEVASAIANYAQNKNYNIILAGKETIDYNGSEVGGMIAGLLNIPFVSLATKLDIIGDHAVAEVDIEGGVEVITAKMPLVLSAAKGMAEARIPNMRGIMAARTKTIEVVAGESNNLVSVNSFELPAPKSAVKLINPENMEELVQLLHSEAKVI